MPKINGADLIKRARAQGYQGYIVAVTAADTPEEQGVLRQAGADMVMLKPLTKEKIFTLIEQLP